MTPPITHPIHPRGTCPHCHQEQAIRLTDGTIRLHQRRATPSLNSKRLGDCPGGGHEPLTITRPSTRPLRRKLSAWLEIGQPVIIHDTRSHDPAKRQRHGTLTERLGPAKWRVTLADGSTATAYRARMSPANWSPA